MLKEAMVALSFATSCGSVLILILMEHAQRDRKGMRTPEFEKYGLNPYFNGTCSKR